MALLALAGVLAVGAPRMITGQRWSTRSPRLALWAWHANAGTVMAASCLAAVSALMHLDHLVGPAWRVCLDAMQGAHGTGGQVGAAVGLVLLGVVTVRLAASCWKVGQSTRSERGRQRLMLRSAGRRDARLQATVVAHERPAAFVLPGRHSEIVVTTAAVRLLSPAELAAVLAHERAHARGHHSMLRNVAHVLHRAFPRLPVFRHGAREVARLVEVCADDTAVRRHRRIDLARALVAMACPAAPEPVLHANGGDVTARLHRLLDPPPPLPAPQRLAVALTLMALPLSPLAIAIIC
jgi:beta-lactamase regulating signal transducer with metallopeptidase domain